MLTTRPSLDDKPADQQRPTQMFRMAGVACLIAAVNVALTAVASPMTWLFTIVLVFSALGAMQFLRSRGHGPTVMASGGLWRRR